MLKKSVIIIINKIKYIEYFFFTFEVYFLQFLILNKNFYLKILDIFIILNKFYY